MAVKRSAPVVEGGSIVERGSTVERDSTIDRDFFSVIKLYIRDVVLATQLI